jgi:hypothetical protein
MLCIISTRLDWLCYGCASSRFNQEPGARGVGGEASAKHTSLTLTHTKGRAGEAPGGRLE